MRIETPVDGKIRSIVGIHVYFVAVARKPATSLLAESYPGGQLIVFVVDQVIGCRIYLLEVLPGTWFPFRMKVLLQVEVTRTDPLEKLVWVNKKDSDNKRNKILKRTEAIFKSAFIIHLACR